MKLLKIVLKSIIEQTFKNWKLLIVDSNSNKETKKILEKYNHHPKIKIIQLKKYFEKIDKPVFPIKAKIINQRMALIIHESACSRIILNTKLSYTF